METCTICSGLRGVLWDAESWIVVLNRNQDFLGKTMIVLKRHAERVEDVTHEEWDELLDQLRDVTARLVEAFAPDHFNYSFLMNVDRHVHMHVVPRYIGSRSFAGAQWDDPEYPDSYRRPVDERRLSAFEEREIRRALGAGR